MTVFPASETFLDALGGIDPQKPYPVIADASVAFMGYLVTYGGSEAEHYLVSHPAFMASVYDFEPGQHFQPNIRLHGDRAAFDRWSVEFILSMDGGAE